MSINSKIPAALLALSLTTGVTMAQDNKLPDTIIAAIGVALDDEYHAEAVYAAALNQYGDVRPFSNIIKAERKHAAALVALLNRYNVEVPDNAYKNGEKPLEALPATIQEACAIGVDAEVANIRLYDETLLPAVVGFPDVEKVFTNLRNASQDKHLPAFQRCASGKNGGGMGHGKGGKGDKNNSSN